jgi:hypothetical protein
LMPIQMKHAKHPPNKLVDTLSSIDPNSNDAKCPQTTSVRWFPVWHCRPLQGFLFFSFLTFCLPQFKLAMHLVKERTEEGEKEQS